MDDNQMFRVFNLGGIALALLTQVLIWYGCWAGNYLCIFFWFTEPDLKARPLPQFDLSTWGLLNFLVFNGFCVMAVIAHIRSSVGDPGEIPKNI
jgi:hypothetical protein